jgi:lipoprotein-anchoring transpeptidase ErfK/SrfK
VKHKGLPAGYTVVVTPKGVIAGYARPNGPKVRNVPSTWHGEPLTMPVRKERRGFDDVRLPGRPNGSTIWVRQSDVFTSASPYEIIVNLATTHLKLVYKGRTVMNVPAGVGTSSNPTPKGRFFVAFYAQSPNAGYGPFVLVTSAHSNTITDWESSGDAMVAIHGPLGAGSVIGNAGAHISHGCIRLHVKDLNRLNVVPVGSPVIVVY